MPSRTDPSIVIYRMRCDANRLSQWAKKYGNAAQQRKASQLVDAIEQAICPIFPVTRDDCLAVTKSGGAKSAYWSDPVRRKARSYTSPLPTVKPDDGATAAVTEHGSTRLNPESDTP